MISVHGISRWHHPINILLPRRIEGNVAIPNHCNRRQFPSVSHMLNGSFNNCNVVWWVYLWKWPCDVAAFWLFLLGLDDIESLCGQLKYVLNHRGCSKKWTTWIGSLSPSTRSYLWRLNKVNTEKENTKEVNS